MTYNAISQADLDVASNATDSDDSRVSSPHRKRRPSSSFQQLPLDHDHIGGSGYLEPARSTDDSGRGRLGSIIRSMTSTSYDMVEEEDYDDRPSVQRRSNSLRRVLPPPLNTTALSHPESPDPPLRSPVSDEPVPLSHPTPDLQSLQGAYLNNVERLERSAERISSADIGSEIRKMDREQKRRSVSSLSSPLRPGSNDGFHARRNVTSPQESVMSASRLAQVSEHDPQGSPDAAFELAPPPSQMSAHDDPDAPYADGYNYLLEPGMARPSSVASGDTYQQARTLFTDFDGVHYVHHEKGEVGRHVSLSRPPLASRPEPYKEPQMGENMVYYPAPVPMMLNLPPKLSQRSQADAAEREKRRTQILSSVPAPNRKSATWISGLEGASGGHSKEDRSIGPPPQLRASAFFEPPSASLDIDVKQNSAVATLDSILDASANAPVTAFTDHPYAGHLGPEVYGSSKPKPGSKRPASYSTVSLENRDSDGNLREGPTEAEAAEMHEGTSLHETGREGGRDGSSQGEAEEEDEVAFTGPPTTLLAELELRKHELKQRRRTAATSVGLHSTLLQLDAVAQKQSEHRRQRPVTLAWESPDAHQNNDDADEDVPLGVLYPEKQAAVDDSRPLGLMEKRELEESEPLSRRRARLRGEPAPPPRTPDKRPTTMYSRHVAEPNQDDSGDEEETLAQRMQRLRANDRTSMAAESEFASEIMAELSHLQGGNEKEKQDVVAPEDETLAERRARLQKEAVEAKRNSTAKIPRYRRSMADLLHTRRPSTMAHQPRNETPVMPRGLSHSQSYDARLSMHQWPMQAAPSISTGPLPYQGHIRNDSAGYGMVHPNTFYSDAVIGMNHLSYARPAGYAAKMMRPDIESGQREMIDRWRQSIV
ncbi:hypothetical protein BDV59DRAFT_188821 [Aspergillus ambiguus]|uniref:uncharacterized protein n=1 Tax=Aspergillus ambiguus TaxID=176160 RepID=UPI003CCDE306